MNTMPPFLKGDFVVNSVNVGSPDLLRANLCTRPQGREFVLFDTVYTSIAQLEAISVDDTDMDSAEFRDSFGRPVLRVIEDDPCFDEGDYAYDQFRFVYFIVGSTLAAVSFSKGSRGISDLQVLSGITAVSPLYEGKLRALGQTI